MNSLLLITHEYPLKRGDASFIESEIQYLSEKFKKIYVFCLSKYRKDDDLLIMPKNVKVNFHVVNNGKIGKSILLLSLIFAPVFYQELFFLIKKKISVKVLYSMIVFLFYAICLKMPIKRLLKANKDIALIYTYWYTQETLSVLLLKGLFDNIPCVTRTHGYDLYKFRNSLNYQPFKLWMDRKIDKIFFASQHGYNYYLDEFARCDLKKYTVARLGIFNKYSIKVRKKAENMTAFFMCSCSYIVSLKRIHFIINALEKIEEYRIHWVHIGDGTEENAIKSIANEALRDKNNISYEFKGFMTNEHIMEFYSENYFDCFITTSETEGGCPVSISEAISFGIPVIATSVGGIPEIVNSDFGILLEADGNVLEISKAIIELYNLSEDKKNVMRQSARLFWESNFSADVNHTKFLKELLTVMKGNRK